MTEELRFYSHNHGELRCLSNFYPSPFELDDELWLTVEHYFQGMKFEGRRRDVIRLAPGPGEAKRLGREHGVRPDWEMARDSVMLDGLRAKFTQCLALQRILLSTGRATLIEAAPRDYYWGEGADRSGRNMLGVLLMQVRHELR